MTLAPTPLTRLRRHPRRAAYDRATIDAILDEALVAHLGFVDGGQPFVIPTLQARVGDRVYVHGSAAGRTARTLAGAVPACLTVTLADGLVLARSAYHHSMNYRSVVVLGRARAIDDPDERRAALRAFTDKLVPGRWDEVRKPTAPELRGTTVLALELTEASAKVRTGPPGDDGDDLALDVWAGVVPLQVRAGEPQPDPRLAPATPLSPAVRAWVAART